MMFVFSHFLACIAPWELIPAWYNPTVRMRHCAMSQRMSRALDNDITMQELSFGSHKIPQTDTFAATKHSFAFVNIKPIVPGTLRTIHLPVQIRPTGCHLLHTALSNLA
jgi:hypothetical protein